MKSSKQAPTARQLKICFRGDSRPPEQIFLAGFQKQKPAQPMAYNHFEPPFAHLIRDVDLETAVCMSARFPVAVMFPLPDDAYEGARRKQVSTTNVYISAIDVYRLKNVHNDQATQAVQNLHRPEFRSRQDQFALTECLYGHELAVDWVQSHELIGAIRVTRTYDSGDQYWNRYDLQDYRANARCRCPAEYVSAVSAFVEGEFRSHRRAQPLPKVQSGGHGANQSSPRRRINPYGGRG